MPNVLLLGGTTEASALASLLAQHGIRATFSYAGRTASPRGQPLPMRIGGFGGVTGLVDHIWAEGITHLVDATHPFAATMSIHAAESARITGVALAALTRAPWFPLHGDCWTLVPDMAAAVAALAVPARRVMLALGRQHVDAFAIQPQHHYLLRFVDTPDTPPPLPDHSLVIDRGPFTVEGDSHLMQTHRIDLVVAKNSGGTGAAAKLAAARALGIPVLMIDRPALPDCTTFHRPEDVLEWIGHATVPPAIERGV